MGIAVTGQEYMVPLNLVKMIIVYGIHLGQCIALTIVLQGQRKRTFPVASFGVYNIRGHTR